MKARVIDVEITWISKRSNRTPVIGHPRLVSSATQATCAVVSVFARDLGSWARKCIFDPGSFR